DRPADTPLIEAPNTLKAAVEEDPAALQAQRDEIVAARERMDHERMRRLAMRVATGARLRLSDDSKGGSVALADLDRTSQELRRRLEAVAGPEAIQLATSLTEITAEALETGEPSRKQLELARDLSMAAYAAFAGEESAQRSTDEVETVVAALRERLKRASSARAA
ncbi:MAG: hypothetical protein MI723_16980, partial [Caulobacterales bacterium]|nr:hypothetical protein [Caulobacterales bacterium]